jgi:YidC/Oxa1 family membrane protein insertase
LPIIGPIFDLLFFRPIITVLVVIINILQSWGIPGAMGLSVILMTLLIRFVLWPVMGSQIKSASKIARLKPHIDELKVKHKDDKAALSKAQMDLYKEHGVNPAGGCLPALIQIPVFLALANAIPTFFQAGGLEKVNNLSYLPDFKLAEFPDPHFLGINLSHSLSGLSIGSPEWMLLLTVPLITAALSFIQSKMMMSEPLKVNKNDSPKEAKQKVELEDTMSAMQSQMLYMMPIMIGVFAYQFAVGVALYWNIFTIIGIIQQHKVSGWGGMEPWIKRIRG